MKILMVCLGNICRSPMAEGILRKKAQEKKLDIKVDSAGFESYHSGEQPDPRAILTTKKHGVDITNIRSRVFRYEDFNDFDKIYVMDKWNYEDVMSVAKTNEDRAKVDFFLNLITPDKNESVGDPYYGKVDGFEEVFQLLDIGCDIICTEFIRNKKNT
ncbi:low molecular weight phosphotyrosine protein phosphatase [Bacteroidales bacterium OttesenSCG-928-C19]|nr:low molecular weight phosphotyrosine protein phosphatase [Bacteroidales bacterium OttesenSCG-928-C19]